MTKPSTAATTIRVPQRTWEFNPLIHSRRVVITFLQGLFAEMPAGGYRWNQDSKLTEIVITDVMPVDLDAIGYLPAITCSRGPAQFGRMFIDDLQHENPFTGERRHSDMLSMMLSINCIADKKLVAEHLSWVVGRHLWILRDLLIQRGFHEIGRGARFEPATAAGEMITGTGKDDWRRASVIMPTYYRYSDWVAPASATKLAGIIFHMETTIPEFRVSPAVIGLVGTGIGRPMDTDAGFEVNRNRGVTEQPSVQTGKTEATPVANPPLTITVEA